MANAIKEKNGLAVAQAIRDTFSSFFVVFKALSSNEENENEEILNEEVLEIKKQESKNKISSLEEMLENNNGTKAKKTGLKNRVKTTFSYYLTCSNKERGLYTLFLADGIYPRQGFLTT